MKKDYYFCACSFGKDSIATILLALQNNEPLDEVVFTEVVYDHSRSISGEHPLHIKWIKEYAKPRLEQMGLKVTILQSDKDYISLFHTTISKSKYNERNGKIRGFPLGNRCCVLRECKLRPMNNYIKRLKEQYNNIIQYVGIAVDETHRLERKSMDSSKISLLAKYGYTEKMAYELSKEYNLLSPIYNTETRGGCWFCPNQRIIRFAAFANQYPHLWNDLKELAKTPNKVSEYFKYNYTFGEIDKRINFHLKQLKLF